MFYSYFIGLDISKDYFDFHILDFEENLITKGQVRNNIKAIQKWKNELQSIETTFLEKTLICLEDTGIYCLPVLKILNQGEKGNIWLENALRIKKSIGLTRGKNDAIDAARIAKYASVFQKNSQLWEPRSENISRLAILVSHRDRMVRNLTSLRNAVNEEKGFIDKELHLETKDINQPVIEQMEKAKKELERKIRAILKTDVEIKRQVEIIQSIPGFGPVITSKLILATNGFTKINTARKLACYSGVAPFPFSSGKSIKGKNRVSHLANKDLKKMFHLAALSTIKKNGIMRKYFERKVEQGKNNMLVINAIRNKLIHILIACINNNTTYQRNYQHSLV